MAKQVRSRISDIAAAIKTRLMSELGLPTERVIWWARAKPVKNQKDTILFLHLRRMADLGDGWDGGGRHDTKVQRILDVGISVDINTDTTSDEPWMFKDSLGYFPIEMQVMDALIEYHPRDSAKNILTLQPISLVGAADAMKYPDALAGAAGMVSFKILHNLDLTDEQLDMIL